MDLMLLFMGNKLILFLSLMSLSRSLSEYLSLSLLDTMSMRQIMNNCTLYVCVYDTSSSMFVCIMVCVFYTHACATYNSAQKYIPIPIMHNIIVMLSFFSIALDMKVAPKTNMIRPRRAAQAKPIIICLNKGEPVPTRGLAWLAIRARCCAT